MFSHIQSSLPCQRRAASGVTILWLLLSAIGLAQTWDGSAPNNNWNNGANWTPAGVPGFGATITLDDTPGANQTINVGGTRQIAALTANSIYDYTLNNGSIVFATGSRQLTYSGAGDLTINSAININGDTTFDNQGSGLLTIDGNIGQWGGSPEVHFTGSGTTVFSGNFLGSIDLRISGTGNNTFNGDSITGGTNVEIEGGTNTFDTNFGGGTTLNVTGGDNTIESNIGGGSSITVNALGGDLSIEGDIGGGANIAVEQGQLALSGSVDGGSSLVVESGGTLLLEGGADLSSGGSNLELDGGTLTIGSLDDDQVDISNLTLSSSSTIDLQNNAATELDLGNISGGGTVNIVNYNSTDQITFNPGGSSVNVPTQFFFNGNPAAVIGNEIVPGVAPVPEPSTYIMGGMLVSFVGLHGWRRRRN